MRKLLAPLILIIMFQTALSFSAGLHTFDQSASPDDPARFQVDISGVEQAGTFRATVSGPHLQRFYVGNVVSLESGENGTIPIEVTPEEEAIQQRYGFTVFVREVTSENIQELSGSYFVERQRDIRFLSISHPDQVKPGDDMTVSTTVQSISGTTIKDYRLEYSVFNRTLERTSSPIIPGGERRISFNIEVPSMSPGDFNSSLRLFAEGELQHAENRTVEIADVRDVRRYRNFTDGFMIYSESAGISNNGNTEVEESLNISYPGYLSPVVSFSEDPDNVTDTGEGETAVWSTVLAPGESFSAEMTVSYWIPVLFVLLSLLSVYGVRKLGDDFRFTKSVESESGELKISMEVRNRSRKTVHDIRVKEFIPDIADVVTDFEMAHPEVRKTSSGTELEWEIGDLKPGESSILQYRVAPRVEVEGGVELRPAELFVEGEKRKSTDRKKN